MEPVSEGPSTHMEFSRVSQRDSRRLQKARCEEGYLELITGKLYTVYKESHEIKLSIRL
jgi:hypothetical protein